MSLQDRDYYWEDRAERERGAKSLRNLVLTKHEPWRPPRRRRALPILTFVLGLACITGSAYLYLR